MIGKDQDDKEGQEQIGPARVADIGKGVSHKDGQHNENQAVHQHVEAYKQQKQRKEEHDGHHGYLGSHSHRFFQIRIVAAKDQEDGRDNQQHQ